jgi:hypothetical protein
MRMSDVFTNTSLKWLIRQKLLLPRPGQGVAGSNLSSQRGSRTEYSSGVQQRQLPWATQPIMGMPPDLPVRSFVCGVGTAAHVGGGSRGVRGQGPGAARRVGPPRGAWGRRGPSGGTSLNRLAGPWDHLWCELRVVGAAWSACGCLVCDGCG